MSLSPIAQLIDKLKHFLLTEKNKLTGDYLKIADAALTQLNEYKSTISDSQSWEFYLTVNEIIKVLMPAAKSQDLGLLRSATRAIFSRRQKLLKGDSLDIHSKTLGNSFSLEVAKIIFPDENPENVLLADALTENRIAPWQDHISMTGDLPAQGQFFRNQSDQIELYAVILERAITRLKEGYFELDKIWLESDPKIESKGEVDASAFEQPLSRKDYHLIKSRSPAFQRLMEYSEGLEETIKNQYKTAYDHFHDLRVGLLKGDAQHAGSELQAGEEAYAAIVKFYKWWEPLPQERKDNIRALSVTNSMYGSVNRLSAILDIIMDVGNADQRNAVRYCIQIKGKMLDEVISNPAVRETLTRLSDENTIGLDPRVPNQTLDEWQTQISQELDHLAPEIKQDDQFSYFVKSKGIVLQTVMHNFFDYSLLQDTSLSLLKDWFLTHGYDTPQQGDAALLNMIGNIQSQQSTNALLLLYAHYSYNPDDTHRDATFRKNILLTAIKNRLYDLSIRHGFPFESLREGFPFFDTVINEDEVTAMHWLSAQFSVEGSNEQWKWTQKMLENNRLNTTTQPLLLSLIQRARELGRHDRAHALEKILAKDMVRREIAAYEAVVKSRTGERHSQQRDDSLRAMKTEANRSLETLDIGQLKASLQTQIAEAKADHAATSWFTWFTSSNLAYYYQRALDMLNTLQGGNNGPAGPGGDVPPPPPPPAAALVNSPPPPPPPPAPMELPVVAREALYAGPEFEAIYRQINSSYGLQANYLSFAYVERLMLRMREEAAMRMLMPISEPVANPFSFEDAPVERNFSSSNRYMGSVYRSVEVSGYEEEVEHEHEQQRVMLMH